jgi:hypothetical protein
MLWEGKVAAKNTGHQGRSSTSSRDRLSDSHPAMIVRTPGGPNVPFAPPRLLPS